MQQPPLLPDVALARVLRLAKLDGTGALVLGTIFALVAASAGHFPFAAIGLLAAGAGAVELHGAALLRQADPRGMNWLIASQPFLLLVIFVYCAVRLWLVEMPPMPEQLQALLAAGAAQWHMSIENYLRVLNRLTYSVLAVASLFFQGGMMLYYLRRRKSVEQALAAEDHV